jgi:hypothetical protein
VTLRDESDGAPASPRVRLSDPRFATYEVVFTPLPDEGHARVPSDGAAPLPDGEMGAEQVIVASGRRRDVRRVRLLGRAVAVTCMPLYHEACEAAVARAAGGWPMSAKTATAAARSPALGSDAAAAVGAAVPAVGPSSAAVSGRPTFGHPLLPPKYGADLAARRKCA